MKEHTADLYEALLAAGEDHGIGDFGTYALNSLRLEKGFRLWGFEVLQNVAYPDAVKATILLHHLFCPSVCAKFSTIKLRVGEAENKSWQHKFSSVSSGKPCFVTLKV